MNPSAKLPSSIPRHSGQIQMIYNHKPSQYFHKYIDGPSTPLYPFGFGLSYTRFAYSSLELSHTRISDKDSFTASIRLTNVGDREGTEVDTFIFVIFIVPLLVRWRNWRILPGYFKTGEKKTDLLLQLLPINWLTGIEICSME